MGGVGALVASGPIISDAHLVDNHLSYYPNKSKFRHAGVSAQWPPLSEFLTVTCYMHAASTDQSVSHPRIFVPSSSFAPTTTMELEISSLRSIARDATSLRNRLGPRLVPKPPTARPAIHSYPTLPLPEPLIDLLLEKGISRLVAEKISTVYLRNANEMKAKYDTALARTIQATTGSEVAEHFDTGKMVTAVYSAYLARYMQVLREWPERAIHLAKTRSAALTGSEHQPLVPGKRPAFKPVGLFMCKFFLSRSPAF